MFFEEISPRLDLFDQNTVKNNIVKYRCISKNVNIVKRFFVFLLISKSETFIYSRFIRCKMKRLKKTKIQIYIYIYIYIYIDYWSLQLMKVKIFEYFLRSIKKRICKTKKFHFVIFYTQYLVGAPLAQMTASVRCGMEAISLGLSWGTIESSARLYCWIDCFSSFSWKDSRPWIYFLSEKRTLTVQFFYSLA